MLTSLAFLFISNDCFAQISVRHDSTKAYLDFSKNTTVGLKLSREYLNTGDVSTFNMAVDYIVKSMDVIYESGDHMSEFMLHRAIEIADESKEIILNIHENKMAVITNLFIVETLLDNYYKMIFLPETRKE